MAKAGGKPKLRMTRSRRPAGRSNWSQRVRFTAEWAEWRRAVFQRDGYRCVWPKCPARSGLEPHHIIRKIERPDLIHDVDNGVTLCNSHHEQINGQESLFVIRFQAYVMKLKARVESLQDLTGLV